MIDKSKLFMYHNFIHIIIRLKSFSLNLKHLLKFSLHNTHPLINNLRKLNVSTCNVEVSSKDIWIENTNICKTNV